MKSKSFFVAWGMIWLGCFLFVACGGSHSTIKTTGDEKIKGDRIRISHSDGVEPMWLQECPLRNDQILPFCGESARQANQQQACASAFANALSKLRMSVGQKVNANLEPDGKGGYRFAIQGVDNQPINVRGAFEDQRWSEEYQGPEGRTYDCYVMITYPKLEYDNLVATAQKADWDRVSKASALHQEGKQLANQGYHAKAVVNFERALGLLSELKESMVTQNGIHSDVLCEQVNADLRVAKAEAGQAERTALVVIRMILDGKNEEGLVARSMHSRVKDWLSAKGVRICPGGLPADQVLSVLSGDRSVASKTAAEKGVGLLLVIDIETEIEAEESNIYYAMARGAFRLIRTSDGRELASADLGPEKGGYPSNRGKALKKALDNLCQGQLKQVVQGALNRI